MWWAGIPEEMWALVSTVLVGLGGQIALVLKWRRDDKLRAEQRELEYQKKINDLLDTQIAQQEKYTIAILAEAKSGLDLRIIVSKNTDVLAEVASALKEFVRMGRGQ